MHLVLPEVSQPRRAFPVGRLGVAHAPVVDGLELPKVSHEDDGDVAEGGAVGIEARLAEELSPALIEAEMHAREEAAADEGHSSTMRTTTLAQVLSMRFAASPCSSLFHGVLGKMWKTEHAVLAPKPMLNAATPV